MRDAGTNAESTPLAVASPPGVGSPPAGEATLPAAPSVASPPGSRGVEQVHGGFRAEFRTGWRALLAAAVGIAFGLTTLPFYTLGLFAKPLAAEFGWSRAEVQGALAAMMVGTVASAWLVGTLLDRYGTRRVALVSQLGLAVGLCGLTFAGPSPQSWLAAWFAMAVLGIGTSPITWTRGIAAWFDRGRGLALGLGLTSTGVMAFLLPPLVTDVIAEHGWRTAYLALAAGVVLIGMPVVALLFRDPPAAAPGSVARTGVGLDLHEALRGRAFWILVVAFALIAGTVAGLLLNLVPLLTDRGLTPGTAAALTGAFALSTLTGRLVCGFLVDRTSPLAIAFVVTAIPAAGCALLLGGEVAFAIALVAVILIGLQQGAEMDLLAFFVARYFGLRNYASILGSLITVLAISSAVGIAGFGRSFDATGSYALALTVAIAAFLLGAACFAGLGRLPPTPGATREG